MRFTYQNGTQPLEGYTILHGIHRGGFGEVYFGRSGGGKEVALKLLHDEDHETELRGVSQCLNLKHPNLVNIFDLKTDVHGDHWIVMEYVSGSNLEDVLSSFPNGLPQIEVRDWLSGIVAGVAHLHDRGIVHRDLKPANIYRENAIVKVGDVGLSKLLESESRRRHTQSVGTVYYMAPEVAQGKYGPEVDVYSLGVVLYEMITGQLPFTGETTAEILMKHLTTQPNLMPIPQVLRPVIAHALEKDPRRRTPNVRQLELEFLRAIQSPAGTYAADPPSAEVHSDSPARQDRTGQQSRPWSNASHEKGRVDRANSVDQSAGRHSSTTRPDSILKTTFAFLMMAGVFVPLLFWLNFRTSAVPLVPIGATITVWPRLIFVLLLPFVVSLTVFRLQSKKRKLRNCHHSRDSVPPISQSSPRFWKNCSNQADRYSVDKSPLERVPELGKSIGRAGLVASLLSLGLHLLMATQFRMSIFPAPENLVLFTAVSILGSWMFLTSHFLTLNKPLSKRHRMLVRISIGALIGTCAFGLQQFLNVHFPSPTYTMKSAFYNVGSHPLVEAGSDPTWLGYVIFFAGWLLIRRDPRELYENRFQRFSLGLMIKSVVMGFLASLVFAFPQWYAMLWAAAISTTIQLASTWCPNLKNGRGR